MYTVDKLSRNFIAKFIFFLKSYSLKTVRVTMKTLNCLHAGYFFMLLLSSAFFFFKINVFKKFLQEYDFKKFLQEYDPSV